MRYMFDAAYESGMAQAPLQPGDIVCYYTDGLYAWTRAQIDKYAAYTRLGISSVATNTGQLGDVEPGNPFWPNWIRWVQDRRAAGVDPTLYCQSDGQGSSFWDGWRHADGVAAFQAAGVPEPHWWVFNASGGEVVPDYAVAVQFGYVGPYDISALRPGWPSGTFDPPVVTKHKDEEMKQVVLWDPDRNLQHFVQLVQGNGASSLYYRCWDNAAQQMSDAVLVSDTKLDDNAGLSATLAKGPAGDLQVQVLCRWADISGGNGAHFWSSDGKVWGSNTI